MLAVTVSPLSIGDLYRGRGVVVPLCGHTKNQAPSRVSVVRDWWDLPQWLSVVLGELPRQAAP